MTQEELYNRLITTTQPEYNILTITNSKLLLEIFDKYFKRF